MPNPLFYAKILLFGEIDSTPDMLHTMAEKVNRLTKLLSSPRLSESVSLASMRRSSARR